MRTHLALVRRIAPGREIWILSKQEGGLHRLLGNAWTWRLSSATKFGLFILLAQDIMATVAQIPG